MSRVKTSDELSAEAKVLQEKLAALRKEARKQKRLEDARAAESKRQEEVRFALAFVQKAKKMHFRDSQTTYYDVIFRQMDEQASSDSVDHVSHIAADVT